MRRSSWLSVLVMISSALVARTVRADAPLPTIDVDHVEYLDVVEEKDGSIWKGVIVEQTPGVEYKVQLAGGSLRVVKADAVVSIHKERNPAFAVAPVAPPAPQAARGPERRPTGLVLGAGITMAIPVGDLTAGDNDTGVSPGFDVSAAYRYRNDNLSARVGGRARFVYWNVPGSPNDAFLWTLEMHAFARAAMRGVRAEPFVGLSLGPDMTGYDFDGLGDGQGFGFGVTLDAGVALLATRAIDIELDVSYHPPISPIPFSDADFKVSYVALQLAGSWHH